MTGCPFRSLLVAAGDEGEFAQHGRTASSSRWSRSVGRKTDEIRGWSSGHGDSAVDCLRQRLPKFLSDDNQKVVRFPEADPMGGSPRGFSRSEIIYWPGGTPVRTDFVYRVRGERKGGRAFGKFRRRRGECARRGGVLRFSTVASYSPRTWEGYRNILTRSLRETSALQPTRPTNSHEGETIAIGHCGSPPEWFSGSRIRVAQPPSVWHSRLEITPVPEQLRVSKAAPMTINRSRRSTPRLPGSGGSEFWRRLCDGDIILPFVLWRRIRFGREMVDGPSSVL